MLILTGISSLFYIYNFLLLFIFVDFQFDYVRNFICSFVYFLKFNLFIEMFSLPFLYINYS